MRRLLSQGEIVGQSIQIREKKDSHGTYYKAFIPGCFLHLPEDLEGCGSSPLAAILSVAQQLANLPARAGVIEMLEREEMECDGFKPAHYLKPR